MAGSNSNRKVANGLVAMGSAAVLAVYSAGYVRTRPAADQLMARSLERRFEPAVEPAEPAVAPPVPVAHGEKKRAKVRPVIAPPPDIKDAPPVADLPAEIPAAVVVPVPTVTVETQAPPPAPVWRDGKYVGWGSCQHGDIQATVVIEAGQITSAQISDCQTRYSCDVIDRLPGQVVSRQRANVQRIAGATQSSDAFYFAVLEALKQAK